jgi:hypothetical protein
LHASRIGSFVSQRFFICLQYRASPRACGGYNTLARSLPHRIPLFPGFHFLNGEHMKTKQLLTISALSLCGLSLCFTNFAPAAQFSSRPVLRTDGGMPPPPIVKKPGSGSIAAVAPALTHIADGGMPPPPIVKKPGSRASVANTPSTAQIADGGMPPPPIVKKPGGRSSAAGIPSTVQIADGGMPPPPIVKKPGSRSIA